MSSWVSEERRTFHEENARVAGRRLASLLLKERNIGDLLKLDYSEATVLVHDYLRREVGGIPLGCFLIATAVQPDAEPDPAKEDTSLIVLRVTGHAALPNASETDRFRFSGGQRAMQQEATWDHSTMMDQYTLHQLRYSGLRCRLLGTFILRRDIRNQWTLDFGADIANFYSGRGMKVYKPDGDALNLIVNFVRPRLGDAHPLAGRRVPIGRVRYSATEREGDTTRNVEVELDPTDLLARRCALFGMSRTGKSNTVKVIASSVFKIRDLDPVLGRVGQLILDPNGEYANDNVQDKGCLRNVWRQVKDGKEEDVITYGLHQHPNDPKRRIIKLNFLGAEPKDWRNREQVIAALGPLLQGKEILDNLLSDQSSQYISAFRNLRLTPTEDWEEGDIVRYRRTITAYRALLTAHIAPPRSMNLVSLENLTNEDLRTVLRGQADLTSAAETFGCEEKVGWDRAREAFRLLGLLIKEGRTAYTRFNNNYVKNRGNDWHDASLMAVLTFLNQPGGMRIISRVMEYHSVDAVGDYADHIVQDLQSGRLVIVDQSTGDPMLNKSAAERLMWRVFNAQKDVFIKPTPDEKGNLTGPKDILVYVEEAHNLLPANNDDITTVWARTAKEGSKFRIGLIYSTQEPSSILSNILKATDNWFVAHLNHGKEVRELEQFYDFSDFSQQIKQVPEPGFLRMRTLSSPYVIPVQIFPYRAEE